MNQRWISGIKILHRWAALDFELMEAFDAGLCPYQQDTGQQITRIGTKTSKTHIYQPTNEELEKERQRAEEVKRQAEKRSAENRARDQEINERGERGVMLGGSGSQESSNRPNIPRIWSEEDIIRELRESYFKMSEVLEYEQKHSLGPEASKKEKTEQDQPSTVNTRQEKQEQYSIDVPDGTTWDQIHIRVVNAHYIEVSYPGARSHENISREKIGLTEKPWNYFIKLARDRGEYSPADEDEKRLAPAYFKEIRKILKELFSKKVSGKPIAYQDKRTGIYKAAFTISLDSRLINSEEIQDAIGDDNNKRKEIEALIKEQQEDMNGH